MSKSRISSRPSVSRPRGGGARLRQLALARPNHDVELHRFIHGVLGIDVVRQTLTPNNQSPFDYISHTFFERGGDCVVWACRGGGKTMLGAVATMLDLLLKPGIQVRVLGGSLEQSNKMYEHLLTLLDRPFLRGITAGDATQRGVQLKNGSRVALLAGSQRSVRGVRVHKLRCDEVEEFDSNVWEAAQLVTRSGRCGSIKVKGSLEALSTMHRPFGLMSRLVEQAHTEQRVFRWSALDVAARCPEKRSCEGCPIWDDCQGKAKSAQGFVPIEDLITQRERISLEQWNAEMMCQTPRRSDNVYPRFSLSKHVVEQPSGFNAQSSDVVMGMDFGVRSPTVVLWAQLWRERQDVRLHVVAEHLQDGITLNQHLSEMQRVSQQHHLPSAIWLGVDPAGAQRQSQTGLSDIDVLREAGYRVRFRRSRITAGIEIIRRLLDHDRLTISPRCENLIRAMQSYHFDADRPNVDEPVKDGPDHACDALRYLVINLDSTKLSTIRGY